jgi:hypothetical protein
MLALKMGTSALGILIFDLGASGAQTAFDAANVAGSTTAPPTRASPDRYTTCEGGVLQRPPGRPRTPVTMARSELLAAVELLGGIKACARAMRCGQASMARYVHGVRAMPSAMATELRAAAARHASWPESASALVNASE